MLRLEGSTGAPASPTWGCLCRTSTAQQLRGLQALTCACQSVLSLRCCVMFNSNYIRLQLHKSAAASSLPGRQLRQASVHAASAGKHRGFGFIEFEGKEDAGDAIDNMNNAELYGRTLRVNYAQPMKIKGGEKGFSHQAVWADSDNWWVQAIIQQLERHIKHCCQSIAPERRLCKATLPLGMSRACLCCILHLTLWRWPSRADLSR